MDFYLFIGNLGLEGVSIRDEVFKLDNLFDMIGNDIQNVNLQETILWSLSCLLNYTPYPSKQILKSSFKACKAVIMSQEFINAY
jgi:hypothetical protein